VIFETREQGQHVAPPPAASRFIVRDRGSAGPRHMRSTINLVPFSSDLLNNSQVPFSVAVAPMALPDPEDDPIQVVDLGELGPVRCTRCKAYMNPYMRFMSSGKTFTCNFCSHTNQTPDAYFCHLGPDGLRRDIDERPELCCGSVEFVATPEYCIRPPMMPTHFFLIDVSQTAIATGATATACSCISLVLDDIPQQERTLIGLATFDSSVHYYAMRGPGKQPQMLVMCDVMDVFAPEGAPLLVPVGPNKAELQELLKLIPDMFAQTRINESCAGAAIEAAINVVKPIGGKVKAFITCLPNFGLHALKQRDSVGVGEKDKLTFLQSQDNTCKTLAMVAADLQVSIDIAFLAQGYVDVATFSDLASSTGGSLYQYTPFNAAMDHDLVLNDLKWNLLRPQGMEAVMRVRCSAGLDVKSYSGHFFRMPSNPTDVYLPAIDADKALLANIVHTEKLQPGTECFVQAALLYSTPDGARRVRVHTLALPVTDNVANVFKGADLDAYMCYLSRRVASTLPGATLAATRDMVTSTIVNTLLAYRKYCASNSSSVQLILPEALKLLPLFTLAILKGPALKDGAKPDDRSMWCASMMSLPAARITPMLYPRLLPVHQMLANEPGALPDGLVCSAESLEAGGVYLLENGHDAYLYVDKMAPPELVQDLLGVKSYEELGRAATLPGGLFPLIPLDNPTSAFVQDLLTKLRIHRSSFMRLRVARKGDAAEVGFFNSLVEDKSTSGPSYVDYLCHVHRLIQNRMAS